MDPAQWKKIEKIYHELLKMPSGERPEFLKSVCGNDEKLKKELLSLLDASRDMKDFMSDPPLEEQLRLDTATTLLTREELALVGEEIGPYRVEKRIASGGMGTVYLASHDTDSFKQKVAIKLIRGGLQNRNLLKRFYRERQTLANLDHPNIARLLYGDTTDEGNPYLVMEFIDGSTIDAYCDERTLSITERLLLFRHICSAVAYAHGKLVVHRDIKPGNILVTRDGIPKLLDFGIVKILDPDDSFSSEEATMTVQRLMTPQYASPEQMRGDPISTATDIYSLGVVLYELLTGHRPFRFSTTSVREAERIICEQDPPKPSTAIKQTTEIPCADGEMRKLTPEMVSRKRGGKPDKLQRRLAGDLDDIIMKALRKEPEKRYSSVEHLAADIERHLAGMPVHAGKGTWSYRSEKFIKRHKAAMAVSTLMLILIVTGAYFAWQNAQRAQNQEAAQQVLDLLTQFYEMPDSQRTARDEIRKLLEADETRQHLKSLADQPEELIRYADTIIHVCDNFHLREQSVEWRSMALSTHEALLEPDDTELGRIYFEHARALHQAGSFDAAQQMLQKGMSAAGNDQSRVAGLLHAHAMIVWDQGDYKKTLSLFEQCMQAFRMVDSPSTLAWIEARIDYARMLNDLGDTDKALTMLDLCFEQVQHLPDNEGARLVTARIHQTTGNVLWYTPRYREAEIHIRKALFIYSKLLTELDARIAACMNDLYTKIRYYYRRSEHRFGAASNFWKKSRKLREAIYGKDSREVAQNIFDVTFFIADGTANRLTTKVLETYRKYWPGDHVRIAEVKSRLGAAMSGASRTHAEGYRLEEAETMLNEALSVQMSQLLPHHWKIGRTKFNLGLCVMKQQARHDEGRILMTEGMHILNSALGEDHPNARASIKRAIVMFKGYDFTEESGELVAKVREHGDDCFYTNTTIVSDCNWSREDRAGVDFEDDHLEKVLSVNHEPDAFGRAFLWIYGRPYNWMQRDFHDYDNLRIQVNHDPAQEIAFGCVHHFFEVTEYYQWVPFEIPIEWLVKGANTFAIYIAHEKDYDDKFSWEYNNLYVGIDTDHDHDRSWWFGSPRTCCEEMSNKALEADKPLLRSNPMFDEHRKTGRQECKGELMVVLELY